MQHAHRIRHLSLHAWDSYYPSAKFFRHLNALHQMPAFNLRTLGLRITDDLGYCVPLLSRNLKTLILRSDSGDMDGPPSRYVEFFDTLCRVAPGLERFALVDAYPDGWLSVTEKARSSLSTMEELKSVYLPYWALSPTNVATYAACGATIITSSSIKHLAGNSRWSEHQPTYDKGLRYASLATPTLLQPPPKPSPTTSSTNRSITELTLYSNIPCISQLLRHNLDITLLTVLDIALVSTEDNTCDKLAKVAHELGCKSVRLRQFRLAPPGVLVYTDEDAPGPTTSMPRLDWSVLAPLTACSRMEVFAVVWDTPIRITEDEFEMLARAWPLLQSLRLWGRRPPPTNYSEPCLSVSALRFLSAHCPDIEDLCLTVSPVGAPTTGLDGIKTLAQLQVASCSLRIGLPAPDDSAVVENMRRFLHRILPDADEWFKSNIPSLYKYDPLTVWRISDPIVDTPGAYNSQEWRDWAQTIERFNRKLGKATVSDVSRGLVDNMVLDQLLYHLRRGES